MKFTFFLALASAQTIFTGGQGKDGMEYQRYENSYMADLDSGFKEYMITLANESVTQETLKFEQALLKLMIEKAQDVMYKKYGAADDFTLDKIKKSQEF